MVVKEVKMLKISKKNQPKVEVFNGVTRYTLACGKDILMARFEYEKGSMVPLHKHSYEQVTTILEGEQKIRIKGESKKEEFIVKKGDTYVVPADFNHEQITIKSSVTIDVWNLSP